MGIAVKNTMRETIPLGSKLEQQKAEVKAALALLDDPRHQAYRRVTMWCEMEGHGLDYFADWYGTEDFLIMCCIPPVKIDRDRLILFVFGQGIDLPTFLRENAIEIIRDFDVPTLAEMGDEVAGREMARDEAAHKALKE